MLATLFVSSDLSENIEAYFTRSNEGLTREYWDHPINLEHNSLPVLLIERRLLCQDDSPVRKRCLQISSAEYFLAPPNNPIYAYVNQFRGCKIHLFYKCNYLNIQRMHITHHNIFHILGHREKPKNHQTITHFFSQFHHSNVFVRIESAIFDQIETGAAPRMIRNITLILPVLNQGLQHKLIQL
ncbi:hypothetical protein DSO57_1010459 [Entomophthora muscae]|uniref:Uncharacterized protein n=1 Tax=Entomophthora muscae TaxID=34485 RepID=A0ACC2TU91_9FUNG|nr:hypothetical protein DSO57_1010459 [Entomophthora muscae]